MKRMGLLIAALTAVGCATVPENFDPVAWEPPEAPEMEGIYAPNDYLQGGEILAQGEHVKGPEDIAVDEDGGVWAGLEDGRIVRLDEHHQPVEMANTGGRPLGLAWDAHGDLIVADGDKGLLRVTRAGEITVLSTGAQNVPFGFTDDVDVAPDGKIYFSDASSKWGVGHFREDFLEARPWGRLLVYDPDTGQTTVLLDELYFANGIAVSPDGAYVLVNETPRYRIVRYWLEGEKAGTHEIFIDNLPGFPDGVSCNGSDTYWVALFTVRNGMLDWSHDSPGLKRFVLGLPQWMQPQPAPYGFALGLDLEGNVIHNLQDTEGKVVKDVTSVEEVGDWLYFGTLMDGRIARARKPQE